LPQNREKITLEKLSWRVPEHYEFAGSKLTPFFAGAELSWRLLA
jgi:dihydroorotase